MTSPAGKPWQPFLEPDAPRMDFVITVRDLLAGQACPANFSGNAAGRATLLNELAQPAGAHA